MAKDIKKMVGKGSENFDIDEYYNKVIENYYNIIDMVEVKVNHKDDIEKLIKNYGRKYGKVNEIFEKGNSIIVIFSNGQAVKFIAT